MLPLQVALGFAILLLAGAVAAHPATPVDGDGFVVHDCNDDYSGDLGGNDAPAHEIHALDVGEQQGGSPPEPLFVVLLVLDHGGTITNQDTRKDTVLFHVEREGQVVRKVQARIQANTGNNSDVRALNEKDNTFSDYSLVVPTWVDTTKHIGADGESDGTRKNVRIGLRYSDLHMANGDLFRLPLRASDVLGSTDPLQRNPRVVPAVLSYAGTLKGDFMPGGVYDDLTKLYDAKCAANAQTAAEDEGYAVVDAGQLVQASPWVPVPPQAAFTVSCAYLACTFDASASADPDGTIANHTWGFGDGGTGAGKLVNHTYAADADVTVTLRVKDNDLATGEVAQALHVAANLPPAAGFAFAPAGPRAGDDVTFTDNSTDSDGTIVSWRWAFGDGGSSTLRNATHAYAAAGDYEVALNVTDNAGASSRTTRTVHVAAAGGGTPANQPPSAAFSFAPAVPTAGDDVTFTDNSTDPDGSVVSWRWAFGDGGSSTLRNATHAYAAAGDYEVALNVTDNAGASSRTTRSVRVAAAPAGNVTPENQPPKARFTFEPASPVVRQDVRFRDASADPDGRVVAWRWAFGDGATSQQRNVSHAFARAGVYLVRLEATDDRGATRAEEQEVAVLEVPTGAILASFAYEPQDPVAGQEVRFRDTSLNPGGSIVRWRWHFGDGTTSAERNVTRGFGEGPQTVLLTVYDEAGHLGSASQTLQVRRPVPEAAPPSPPPADDGPPAESEAPGAANGTPGPGVLLAVLAAAGAARLARRRGG